MIWILLMFPMNFQGKTPEEQQSHSTSSGGSGNVVCKKIRPPKIPQRGLGVAQLEKIRLEELSPPSSPFKLQPPPLSSSTNISFPMLNQNQNQNSNTSSSSSLSSTNSVSDVMIGNNNAHLSFINQQFLPHYQPKLVLPNDSHSSPNLNSNFQLPPSNFNSMVNFSAASSSTNVNCQIERPSLQNYYAKEKIVGIKRPYPCSLDNLSELEPFNYDYRSLFPFHINNSDKSASYQNGGTKIFEILNPQRRDALSSESSSKNSKKENRKMIGDFLTLAPPESETCTKSTFKHPSSVNRGYFNHHIPDFESLRHQMDREDLNLRHGLTPLTRQPHPQLQPYFDFFAQSVGENRKEAASSSSSNSNNGELEGERGDLDLKL